MRNKQIYSLPSLVVEAIDGRIISDPDPGMRRVRHEIVNGTTRQISEYGHVVSQLMLARRQHAYVTHQHPAIAVIRMVAFFENIATISMSYARIGHADSEVNSNMHVNMDRPRPTRAHVGLNQT